MRLFLALMVLALSANGAQLVETLVPQSLENGKKVFNEAGGYGCIACHGLYGHGGANSISALKNVTVEDLNASFINVPVMALLAPSILKHSRIDVVNYLNWLEQLDGKTIQLSQLDEGKTWQKGLLIVHNSFYQGVKLSINDVTFELKAQQTQGFVLSEPSMIRYVKNAADAF